MWGRYIVFPKMLGDPRAKPFIDLCPGRWEVNAEMEGSGRGCQPPPQFCPEVGLCPSSLLGFLSLLSGSGLAFREKPELEHLISSELAQMRASATGGTALGYPPRLCPAVPSTWLTTLQGKQVLQGDVSPPLGSTGSSRIRMQQNNAPGSSHRGKIAEVGFVRAPLWRVVAFSGGASGRSSRDRSRSEWSSRVGQTGLQQTRFWLKDQVERVKISFASALRSPLWP